VAPRNKIFIPCTIEEKCKKNKKQKKQEGAFQGHFKPSTTPHYICSGAEIDSTMSVDITMTISETSFWTSEGTCTWQ